MLNQVEQDFVEFMSVKTGKSRQYIEEVYQTTKRDFKFNSPEFKEFTRKTYDLNKLLHDELSEVELLETYKYHGLISLYRFVSYSFEEKNESTLSKRVATALKLVLSGKTTVLLKVFQQKQARAAKQKSTRFNTEPLNPRDLAEYLVGLADNNVSTVVDYGCGPAYVSFAIAMKYKNAGLPVPLTILVDLDWITREFVQYRFTKHNLPFQVVEVTEDNLYPVLPPHDLCIATEVMEHVKEPLRVFKNIHDSLRVGGILHGNYEDHDTHMLHVSPNLKILRDALEKHKFKILSYQTYKKTT